MKKLILITAAFLSLLIFFACQKDADSVDPQVDISIPNGSEIYANGDTVAIDADISDDLSIASVEVNLCDVDFIPVGKSYFPPISGNPMHLNFLYPLDNYYLETGFYNIRIKVSDGNNIKLKYRTIRILEHERKKISVAVCTQNQSVAKIYVVDDNGTQFIDQINDSILEMKYLPYNRVLTVLTKNSGILKAYGLVGQNNWTKTMPANPPFPSYTALGVMGNKIFLGSYTPKTEIFNYLGSPQGSLYGNSGYFTKAYSEFEQYIGLIEQNKFSPKDHCVSLLLKNSNYLKQVFYYDHPILNMYHYPGEFCWAVFGNKNNKGAIYVLDESFGYIPDNLTMLPSKINVVRSANGITISGNEDGVYTIVPGLFTSNFYRWNTIPTEDVAIDEINNQLYFAQGNTMNIYEFKDYNFIKTVYFVDNITHLNIIYNR